MFAHTLLEMHWYTDYNMQLQETQNPRDSLTGAIYNDWLWLVLQQYGWLTISAFHAGCKRD